MKKSKSLLWMMITKGYWLFSFIVIMLVVNFLTIFIKNPTFKEIVSFTNQNISLIIIMAVIFCLAELFDLLNFPFNLPAPLFNATGAIFMISFIQKIFLLLGDIINEPIVQVIGEYFPFVSVIIFVVVVIAGYVGILIKLLKKSFCTADIDDNSGKGL
jgi:hypothetical protein